MKVKLILSLITTLCITSITFVYAEPTYDKEILFNNIPWGSSAVEVENMISGWWIDYDEEDRYANTAHSCAGLGVSDDYDYAPGIGMSATCMKYTGLVGGYEVDDIGAYYAYTFPNDEVNREHENTSLYGADYNLIIVDANKAFDDLTNKLCGLYGNEYKAREVESLLNGLWTTYTWEGANDTYVSLSKYIPSSDSSFEKQRLQIQYARLDGDELLKRNTEIVNNAKIQGEESIYGNGDNSGL